jgi:hypothetical protein
MLLLQRRLPLTWMAAGVFIFVLLNPAKHIFRAERNWAGFDKERLEETKDHLLTGPADAAKVWVEALEQSWLGEADSTKQTSGALDRLNYLSGVARTVDWAGTRVPYDRGSRWGVILEFFVPRAIHPNKPLTSRVFNDRYNYLFGMQVARVTRSATVALPLVADGYWNFGWLGVVLLGTFGGIYWGTLASLWNRQHWGLSWIAMALFMACSVVTPFFGYASGSVLTAFGLAMTAWGLYLASTLLPARRKLATA